MPQPTTPTTPDAMSLADYTDIFLERYSRGPTEKELDV